MKTHIVAVVIAALVVVTGAALAEKACPRGPELKVWGGLDSKPKIADGYEPDRVEIGIGSYKLLELRGPAAGYTLPEREVAVYNRLTEALSQGPISPGMICVGKVRSAPTVYVGPVRFISAYARDAAAAGTTQEALAQAWAARLVEVLPKITVATGAAKDMPPGPGEPVGPGAGGPAVGAVEAPYELIVGGTLLFRLRGRDGFASLEARGLAASEQVIRMLSDGREKGVVARAQQVKGDWTVVYAGDRVVTVTAADATANKTTPELLAKAWAAKLSVILPKLKGPTGAMPATCP